MENAKIVIEIQELEDGKFEVVANMEGHPYLIGKGLFDAIENLRQEENESAKLIMRAFNYCTIADSEESEGSEDDRE